MNLKCPNFGDLHKPMDKKQHFYQLLPGTVSFFLKETNTSSIILKIL